MGKHVTPLVASMAIIVSALCSHQQVVQQPGAATEEVALQQIANEVKQKAPALKDKAIGVFDFTAADGTVAPETKRLSTKLLEYMIKTTELKFIERSELDKILRAQEIEQTGIVDTETARPGGGISSIDVMITGTLLRVPDRGELGVKVVNIGSGQIYLMSSAAFAMTGGSGIIADKNLIRLHREQPEKLDRINRSCNELKRLSVNRPVVFLLAMADRDDIAELAKKNPRAAGKLQRRMAKIEADNPRLAGRIQVLRKNLPPDKG